MKSILRHMMACDGLWHMIFTMTVLFILFMKKCQTGDSSANESSGTNINPRRAGGVFERPPPGFSQIAGKRRRGAPPFLAQLFIHLFRTLCENFRPRSLMVRSPGHVK